METVSIYLHEIEQGSSATDISHDGGSGYVFKSDPRFVAGNLISNFRTEAHEDGDISLLEACHNVCLMLQKLVATGLPVLPNDISNFPSSYRA